MRIAILGGTGDIGQGLVLRWAVDSTHELVVGSRDAGKAARKVEEYETELASRGAEAAIEGAENGAAAADADVVVLAVPPYYVADTVEEVADRLDDDAVLVSPAVGMDRDDDGFHADYPPDGSVTALAAAAAPDPVSTVGTFHNLPADVLANLDADLRFDTLVVGDDPDARGLVADVAETIDGLRALDAGPLANAPEVEGLVPLLLNVSTHNDGYHDVGVRFEAGDER